MKFKKKAIVDNVGSSSQMRAVVREALWGIVEKIGHVTEIQDDLYDQLDSTISPEGLPISFSSAKKCKNQGRRKDKQRELKRNSISKTLALPVPPYNGTLLENHVYRVKDGSPLSGAIVRLYGISSMGEHCVMRAKVIGPVDSISLGQVVFVPRSDLVEIPAPERAATHQLVQQDEQRILQSGIPVNVHLKYWDQRYRLLSRIDRGVRLDAESWYSITPEAAAKHVTASCLGRARALGCRMEKIIDCFSGCGGNTIPFLAAGKKVISVDFDQLKLEHLRHNCGVYDVDQSAEHCACADVYALLEALLPAEKLSQLRDNYQAIMSSSSSVGDSGGSDGQTKERETALAGASSSNGPCSGEHQQEGHGARQKVACVLDVNRVAQPVADIAAASVKEVDEVCKASGAGSECKSSSVEGITDATKQVCAEADLVILSPPWGGPDYLNAEQYCLYTMLPSGCGLYLTMLAMAVCPNALLLLPVNTSVEQVAYIAEVVKQPFVIEYIQINRTPKLMAVYMGAMVNHHKPTGLGDQQEEQRKRAQETSAPHPQAKHQRFEE